MTRLKKYLAHPAMAVGVMMLLAYSYFYQAGGWNQNSRFDLTRAIVEDVIPAMRCIATKLRAYRCLLFRYGRSDARSLAPIQVRAPSTSAPGHPPYLPSEFRRP